MNGRLSRSLLCAGAALLAGVTVLAPVPALASGPTTGVTVFLKAPDLSALQQLAEARGLTHAQRVAVLTKLLPSAAVHAAAIKALDAAGMKVTGQTAWSVSATAPSSTVADAFGTHPAMRAHATPAQRRAATGPYLSLPPGLDAIATAAFPTSGGPAAFSPADAACVGCRDGNDFRNAYTTPAQTALNQPPYSGLDPAGTLTIATVQLAGWNAGDLTHWAALPVGVPFDPATDMSPVNMTTSTVTSSIPSPASGDTGDEEVDLDQEALLSTDPYAHQRPYFALNTDAGYNGAFAQVVDDVMQDSHAFQGGDPHIAALSVSWGQCEADTDPAAISDLEDILMSLEAAGVTVFASSGDDGIYDNCSSGSPDVDYPASSPEVVGVGATTLNSTDSAPNNGANWSESAWSCISAGNCLANGGSGGGASPLFSKPIYQDAVTDTPFSTSTARLVPDISANGNPATGFPVYSSDATDTTGGHNILQIGGTSLSTPESAALFTNVLAEHGLTSGVGDIHHALYQAYAANNGSFRDVTQGVNGATLDDPNDPSVNAATGYDTVTGLGAPLWPALATYFLKPATPPTAAAAITLVHPHSSSSPRLISARWTGSPSTGGLPVQQASVSITLAGQSLPFYDHPADPVTGSYTFPGSPGATYILSVTAVDLAANTSKDALAAVSVPVDDRRFKFTGTWHHVAGGSDIAGSASETSHRGATATATATGRSYALVVKTGPGFGKLSIAQGFTTLRTINLYSAHGGTKTVTFSSSSASPTAHTFRFTCLGKKSHAATGTKVGIDAMTVVY